MQPYRKKYLWNVYSIEQAEEDDVFKISEKKNFTLGKVPRWKVCLGKH
jgi:hypothetical protein